MVMILPIYEEDITGVYYNTAVVVDADGTILGKYRKHHIPHLDRSGRSSTSAPATSATRSSTPRSARSASTSATTGTSPRAGASSASTARTWSSTRTPPSPASRNRLWEVEGPCAAVANGYFVLQPNRVGREDNEYGDARRRLLRHQPGHRPARQLRRRARLRRPTRRSLIRDLDMDMVQQMRDDWQFYRDRRPDSYTSHPEAVEEHAMTTTLITGGTVVTATGRSAADVLIDGETIVAVLAPGLDAARHRPRGIRRHRRSTRPASTSSPAASTRTPTWSCRSAAPRPATPSRPAPAPRPGAARPRSSTSPCRRTASAVAGRPGRLAREGRRQLRDRLRLPPDHRRRRRGLAEGDGRAASTRASPATSCSWPTRASSTPTTRQILQGDAEGRRPRAADDDARRERPGHRRARRAARRARARPTRTSTASPAPGRWRRRPPTARSCSPNLTGAPLYVVHVSAKQAVEQLAAARDKGQNVFGETCPQYLYLSLEEQLGATQRGVGRLRGREVGVLDAAALARGGPPGPHVAGAAHQRPADGLHRPLPVLHEGPEGARPRRLPQDPERHRLDRAPHGPACTRASSTGEITLERWVELTSHDPGAHVRAVRHEGRHRARAPTPTSWSTTRTATPRSAYEQDPPHEHGPLRLGGLRDRRPRRHRALAAARSSSTTASTSARKGDGQFLKRGLSRST